MNIKILNYIKTLSDNEKIQKLLIETIGKIFLKQDNVELFIKENETKIVHIRDWIASVIENNEQWKNPRVLMLEALNNSADKYFEKKNNKIQTIELDETHEKLIADLGEYYVVQMLTVEALDNESKQMQHCIGHGYYDETLKDDKYLYLSLRDKFNKAHVTLEINNGLIEQLQGKQNQLPDKKYLEKILPWLQYKKYGNIPWYKIKKYYENGEWINFKDIKVEENIDFVKIDSIDNIDIIKIISDKYYLLGKEDEAIYIMPDNNISYKRNTKRILFDKICKDDDKCQKFVKIIGDNKVNFYYNNIDYIYNDLDKKVYSIYELPDKVKVTGDIALLHSKISKLPNDLEISGDLNLEKCYNLEKMPDMLQVNGEITINGCKKIKEFKAKKINGDLSLINTNIEQLEDNIIINGIILIKNSKIKKLPENMIVKKNLLLEECDNIIEVSDSIKIGGFVSFKNLEKLRKVFISEFNDNLSIRNCNNLELEKNFLVNGTLNIDDSTINIMPENINIKKSFYICNSKFLNSWKNSNVNVEDSFIIEDSSLIDLPEKIECKKIIMDKKYIELLNKNNKCNKIEKLYDIESDLEYNSINFINFN